MAKSFFTGNDTELYVGSQNFAGLITATPTAFGLTATQATAYGLLNDAYAAAYQLAAAPTTRTRPNIAAKDAARAALKVMASDLAKVIDGTASVTNKQRIQLGLNVRKTRTTIPVPSITPGVDIVSVTGTRVNIRVHNDAVVTKRAKPAGTAAAWVYTFVGETYPSDPGLWDFQGSTTKNTFEIDFPLTLAGGTQVWICAAWINAKQQAGPVCAPVTTNLQFSGTNAVGMKIAA